jgi:hypothetical protein
MSDKEYSDIVALRNDRRQQLALQEQADATRGAICDAIKSKRPNLDECSPAVADYIRRIEFIQQSIWCEKCCADKKHPSIADIADIMDGAADDTIHEFEQVKAALEPADSSDSDMSDEERWISAVDAHAAKQQSMDSRAGSAIQRQSHGQSQPQSQSHGQSQDFISREINQLKARVAALELMTGMTGSQQMPHTPQITQKPCPASIFGDFD